VENWKNGRYKQKYNLLFSIIPSFQPSIIALNNYMSLQMNILLHFLYRTHVILATKSSSHQNTPKRLPNYCQ